MAETWQEAFRGVQVHGWTGYVIDNGRIERRKATAPNLAQREARWKFDRLLALRFGYPEEAVDEGVMFRRHGTGWYLTAGRAKPLHLHLDGNPTDPLLARVLLWKSVGPPLKDAA